MSAGLAGRARYRPAASPRPKSRKPASAKSSVVATGPPDERSGNECAWRAVGRSLGLATVGLVAIWLAASGGGDDADRSDGFERFKEDGLAVEYPSSWTVDEGGEAGPVISVHPERDENGLFPRLSVNRQEREFRGAPQAGGVMATQRPFHLNEGRLVSDRRAEVPGSEGAWRVETRFEIRLDSGGTVPGRAVELIALKDDEQVLLTLAGPAETMDRLPVDRIVGSLDLS